jgi:RimJ/RimL family protein N-acetyltransferase
MDNNPNVHQYLGNNPLKSIEESTHIIGNIQKQYRENGIGRYAVILKETHEFIGWSGLKFITETENNHSHFYEIGYRLHEKHWKKGYGYEAAKAWLDYGFQEMKIPKLFASANKENTGSIRILHKIGMKITSEYDWNGIPCHWFELENGLL